MNTLLLLFFVLPLSVIIFSIALENIFNNPILVSAIIFAISLIVAFALFSGSSTAIIVAIIYGIIALVVALIVDFVGRYFNNNGNNNNNNNDQDDDDDLNLPNTQACRVCRCQKRICRCLCGRNNSR